MLISMTGYCSKNQQLTLPDAGTVNLTLEIKTLNGRFFELTSKLPSSFSSAELAIGSLLQEKLIRGRVYLSLRVSNNDAKLASIEPSWTAIDQYVASSQAIKERYKLAGDVTVADIMQLPDVFVALDRSLSQRDEEVLLDFVGTCADGVMQMRSAEGTRLERDLVELFGVCGSKLEQIKITFAQEVIKAKDKLKELMAIHDVTHESQPEVEEAKSALRRMDIHEELTRFASHLESIKPLFEKPGREKGKRFDFILQEFLRETNTMMAKCSAYGISASGIDIKVALEKAREQVQNIL